ncbi:3-oxosteroid 1-dehydrogenase [Methylobacterium crusticola]|uniref:3-oxosteroid 1-dehydrogenase n=1 Tax=Methylobacterium crusticola TaxID=1697972 RepID=A0ABQ4QXX7_9HYPH|nr:FAD-binding protein [Methylobacterium crusticola]GJD50247.1 3-oxosteroid 1-dehydrogenase [Methylobacterium crusticola]
MSEAAAHAAAPATFDLETDVICVGAGAGGMSAALTAAIEGLGAILVEKTDRVGGSTAVSGGAVWIPGNARSAEAGHPDTLERAKLYLDRIVGNWSSDAMKLAFLEAGPRMLDYLERHTELRLVARTYSPDYYPDAEGAALGGRSMDPLAFDGRALGAHFATLRDPLPEFSVLGGMMVTMTDVHHLLGATRSFASWKHGMRLVARYAADRLRHRRGTRLVLGNALAGRLYKSVLDRGIPVWLESPARRLVLEDGRVVGLVVAREGREVAIRARRGVVLATGGFPNDPERRAALLPRPTGAWSMAPAASTGDGLRLGEAAGATVRGENASNVFHAPVSILEKPDGTVVRYPHLVWERAKPGLMAVNGAGRRFVNEATSYHEFGLAMHESHRSVPSIPAYLICDAPFLKRWGLGLALPGGRPFRHLVAAGYLAEGRTLDDLARQLGLDAAALAGSVASFNRGAQQGRDEDFGKGGDAYNRYLGDPRAADRNPCLGTLETAPFYAVRVYPGDIGTAGGIVTDENARVLDRDGRPIPGLYAAGNDMNSVMGGTYPGPGITLGPALTFGWLAGRHLARNPA